jgi:hypothetical protein
VFENIYLNLPEGIALTKRDSDYTPWLNDSRANIDFFYWDRYKNYLLESKGWPEGIVSTLDDDSDVILDFLGNPKDSKSWIRHGLLIGDIQSGKTANYTSVINKAADAGYQVIILLTGTTENLRIQTQSRIDMEFIGVSSSKRTNATFDADWKPIGVAKGNGIPQKQPISYTSVNQDFQISTSEQISMRIQDNSTSIFVIKKNKTILNNLSSWLSRNNAKDGNVYQLSALVIDDEADNASVNTNKAELDPTAINAGIRSILAQFSRASYLAVTATPFANIFIDADYNGSFGKDDLFPSDYIYLLSASNQYVGAAALFSEDADPETRACLQEIDTEEMENKLKLRHKKDEPTINNITDLPECLVESVRYFLLVQGIADFRLGLPPHRSMLINVSRFTGVQNSIREVLHRWLHDDVWSCVRNNHMMPEWADNPNTKEFYRLKLVWDKYNLEQFAGCSWATFSKEKLWESISKVNVVSVNQSKESSPLDYSNYPSGYRVIAVGGNSLSRGLTLEMLLVSFFYRNSKAYDTLMQMGRWFGYRSGYLDLFKIWMSADSIGWYETITEATDNLKKQIQKMNKYGRSPSDFGLAVQRQPLSRLLITAKNKMRNTEEGAALPVMIAGSLIETPRLYADPQINKRNGELIRKTLMEISKVECGVPDGIIGASDCFWTNVPKELVADLVAEFKSHEWNLDYQSMGLSEYIKGDSNAELWDVVLDSLDKGKISETEEKDIERYQTARGELSVIKSNRTADTVGDMLRIGKKSVRVGSGGISRIGLEEGQYNQIIKTIQEDKDPKRKPKDSDFLSVPRHPLMIIYSMHVKVHKNNDKDEEKIDFMNGDTIYAIGLGFPQSDAVETNRYVQYIYNSVAIQNYFGFDDFYEESEEDE